MKKYKLWKEMTEKIPSNHESSDTPIDPSIYWQKVKVSASKRAILYFYMMSLVDMLFLKFIMGSVGELTVSVFEDIDMGQFRSSPFGGTSLKKESSWKKRLSLKLSGLRAYTEQTEVLLDDRSWRPTSCGWSWTSWPC
jgi:hypothetical protein